MILFAGHAALVLFHQGAADVRRRSIGDEASWSEIPGIDKAGSARTRQASIEAVLELDKPVLASQCRRAPHELRTGSKEHTCLCLNHREIVGRWQI